jgi:hypothetical protein
MITSKNEIISQYILPIFQPVFTWFNQYGISSVTVVCTPIVILFLLTLNYKRLNQSSSITSIIVICSMILAIILFQFNLIG